MNQSAVSTGAVRPRGLGWLSLICLVFAYIASPVSAQSEDDLGEEPAEVSPEDAELGSEDEAADSEQEEAVGSDEEPAEASEGSESGEEGTEPSGWDDEEPSGWEDEGSSGWDEGSSGWDDEESSGWDDAAASDEPESSFQLNAMMKLQAGMFAPGLSSRFKPHPNFARNAQATGSGDPCDPVVTPRRPCTPLDHGKRPGSPSIARATLQIEAHWDFSRKLALHAIVRAVRSAALEADKWAQPSSLLRREPGQSDQEFGQARRAFNKDFAHGFYQEVDLREFYLDYFPADALSFRIGRQQVAWGETGSYRLLDVVNPTDSTWHFAPLESFEDQRIPLWMALMNIEIYSMRSSLELLYIPGIDRRTDLVNVPLTMVGAWGLPYSNRPAAFEILNRDFQYPGGGLDKNYMRGGARLKGLLGDYGGYSLVYMYTHMMIPTVTVVDLQPLPGGGYDSLTAERVQLEYPRQHIVGGSAEYTAPSPLATTFRFEASVEPNRTFAPNTSVAGSQPPDGSQFLYTPKTKPVVNYALVVQRPTMIRWLNPTQNFLLVGQFRHTAVAKLDPNDSSIIQLIGFNDWEVQKHSFTVIAHARTSYFHGIFEPRLTGVWIINPYYGDSGFVTADFGFRIGPHYRVNIQYTDFIGKNAYRDLGLFRDRDEVHASLTLLF